MMRFKSTELLKEASNVLKNIYGDRLDKVILFGSYARGEQTSDSDVDLLVVLKDSSVLAGKEIRFINQFLFPIALNHGVTISAHPISSEKFKTKPSFFINRVRKEGIEV